MSHLPGFFLGSGLLAALLVPGMTASAGEVQVEEESLLMRPMHMEVEPPHVWCVRTLSIGVGEAHGRTREVALGQIKEVLDAVRGGASFSKLVTQSLAAAGVGGDGTLGVTPPGVLAPEFDRFLESAALGEVSEIIETTGALHLVQRIEPRVAVRQLFLEGREASVKEQLLELRAQLVGGGSFRELAREHSMDRPSAARGGDYAVFERGPRDSQLKRAAFELELGEVSLPIETPLGWHLLQRVSPSELSTELAEKNWGRFRALLITHAESPSAANPLRSRIEARDLANEIYNRLLAGDPFEPIARFSNDDPGGKERSGDLGWVHRRTPGLPQYLSLAFLMKPGETGRPFETASGWILVQRSR